MGYGKCCCKKKKAKPTSNCATAVFTVRNNCALFPVNVIPGATVTIKLAGATVATGTTDAGGHYSYVPTAPGTYTYTIAAPTYATSSPTGLVIPACTSATRGSTITVGAFLNPAPGFSCCGSPVPQRVPSTLFMTTACGSGTVTEMGVLGACRYTFFAGCGGVVWVADIIGPGLLQVTPGFIGPAHSATYTFGNPVNITINYGDFGFPPPPPDFSPFFPGTITE
jgi:hypothetical protein